MAPVVNVLAAGTALERILVRATTRMAVRPLAARLILVQSSGVSLAIGIKPECLKLVDAVG